MNMVLELEKILSFGEVFTRKWGMEVIFNCVKLSLILAISGLCMVYLIISTFVKEGANSYEMTHDP